MLYIGSKSRRQTGDTWTMACGGRRLDLDRVCGLRRECMRLIVLGLAILLHGQAVSAAPMASLVQAAGLRAVDEPQPAADFQLPDLEGQLAPARPAWQGGAAQFLGHLVSALSARNAPDGAALSDAAATAVCDVGRGHAGRSRQSGAVHRQTPFQFTCCLIALVPSVRVINCAACRPPT